MWKEQLQQMREFCLRILPENDWPSRVCTKFTQHMKRKREKFGFLKEFSSKKQENGFFQQHASLSVALVVKHVVKGNAAFCNCETIKLLM